MTCRDPREPVSVQSARYIRGVRRPTKRKALRSSARERLRQRHRPDRVRILFVGESPPASGRFFYQADSGLYRAVRDAFLIAFPPLKKTEFLDSFRSLGCYLVDLCGEPVDKMSRQARRSACRFGEVHLARTIRALRPKIIVTVVRSINRNVRRAEERGGWAGLHLEVPYPGRWYRARMQFTRQLVPLLRETVG
jgi:Uracil DNA glycosylase superfamily